MQAFQQAFSAKAPEEIGLVDQASPFKLLPGASADVNLAQPPRPHMHDTTSYYEGIAPFTIITSVPAGISRFLRFLVEALPDVEDRQSWIQRRRRNQEFPSPKSGQDVQLASKNSRTTPEPIQIYWARRARATS